MAETNKSNTKAYSLNDVSIYIDNELVGMVQTVEVNLTVNKNTLYESGKKGVPVDRVFLKKEVTGSFERVLVSKDLLVKLWPSFDEDPAVFTLKGTSDDPLIADRDFMVKGCTIDGFPLSMDLENETKQSIAFTGTGFDWI